MALTFQYHGIAEAELEAARAIGAWAQVSGHRFVRLPDLKEAADIRGAEFPGLPGTYIPMRNSIFYSVAASIAEETGAVSIVGGHNRDDIKVFDDVGDSFFAALQKAFRSGSSILGRRRLTIDRPLRALGKPEVIRLASTMRVPLGLTWSCHRDGAAPCRECEGCLARRRSFELAKIADPLWKGRGQKIT